jgi:hypothetical protein
MPCALDAAALRRLGKMQLAGAFVKHPCLMHTILFCSALAALLRRLDVATRVGQAAARCTGEISVAQVRSQLHR